MSTLPISPLSSAAPSPALLAAARRSEPGSANPRPSAADVQRAAKQFEAILVRQLLAPALEPLMSNSLGGSGGTGGGMYGFMLTDAMANAISEGGGLGFSSVIQSQFSTSAGDEPALERHE